MNKVIKGIALNNSVRIAGFDSTNIVQEITKSHLTSPCASAALGRTISIVALMGLMRNEEKITVTINGGGPIGSIYAQYLPSQQVRGYVENPQVDSCINDLNKLAVGETVGRDGELRVDIQPKNEQHYFSSVPLTSGEISDDFTYFFASSEQTPSIVSAGVLVNPDGNIGSSGALIVQLLPEASEEDIEFLESNLNKFTDLSGQLLDNNILEIVNNIFNDFQLLEETHVDAGCTCSREDMYAKISTLSIEDLKEILIEDEQLEAVCPWCNSKYLFTKEDLEQIIENKESGCFLYN